MIGGVFQSGGNYPAPYNNGYMATDFINGWMRWVQVDANDAITATGNFIQVNESVERMLDVEIDPASGDLYYVTEHINFIDGSVFRISYLPESTPRRSRSGRLRQRHRPLSHPGAGSPWSIWRPGTTPR